MANDVLGGVRTVFANRLCNEVRDTHCRENDLVSVLYGLGDTRPENVEQLIKATKDVIKKLVDNGITEEELSYHKTVPRNVEPSNISVI